MFFNVLLFLGFISLTIGVEICKLDTFNGTDQNNVGSDYTLTVENFIKFNGKNVVAKDVKKKPKTTKKYNTTEILHSIKKHLQGVYSYF